MAQEKSALQNVTIQKLCEKIPSTDKDRCKLFAHTKTTEKVGELFYHETEENKIEITHLKVKDGMRYQRIGTSLMNCLFDESKTKKHSEIVVRSAAKATRFYQKLGFECEKDSFDLIMDNSRFCYKKLEECQQLK